MPWTRPPPPGYAQPSNRRYAVIAEFLFAKLAPRHHWNRWGHAPCTAASRPSEPTEPGGMESLTLRVALEACSMHLYRVQLGGPLVLSGKSATWHRCGGMSPNLHQLPGEIVLELLRYSRAPVPCCITGSEVLKGREARRGRVLGFVFS